MTPVPDLAFGSSDYELLWPRILLIRELTVISSTCQDNHPNRWIELLFEEAFLGDTPVQNYRSFHGPWGRVHVEKLLARASQLREHHAPSPYWSARHGAVAGGPRRSPNQLRGDFARLISSLQTHGYLDRAFPKICTDDRAGMEPELEALLVDRLGVSGLWPLQPAAWSNDVFYDLVEVFHDIVARPRTRDGHREHPPSWSYSDFATGIGRALYRWKVNRLLESGGVELRLAEDGEDVGRLVQLVDDARTDLIERNLTLSQPDVAVRVRHAIALFRRRGASTEDKRSAVVTLAGILEGRLPVIKETSLLTGNDESALFNIANNFALRHQDIKQQRDYDPAFLDWIFWWYLATVELTDRIRARNNTGTAL